MEQAEETNTASGELSARLHMRSIHLEDFRNYERFSLEDVGERVIIVGPNAVGKTNIVEAAQLLTAGRSFRRPGPGELVRWGKENARIYADFSDGKRFITHEMSIVDGKRVFKANFKKKSPAEIARLCPSVLFIPDDLQMVKAASSRRRDMIDNLAAQLSPQYGKLKREYDKTLRQRNMLLREEMASGPLFDSWTESLIVNGSRLYVNRLKLFKRLARCMVEIYGHLVPGETLSVSYIASWNRFGEAGKQLGDVVGIEELVQDDSCELSTVEQKMAETIAALGEAERQRKSSLVGPHKDELGFFIEGKNARLFASQGQQRTIVLVEKLAEVELTREILGSEPVLLLDDVMSELDAAHRDALTQVIARSAQTFITTTNLGYFDDRILRDSQIVELKSTG